MHDDCSFVGGYKELKKHVRSEHPCAKPREVDPDQEHKWRWLERERERDDVLSTITSSMPGSVVFGDYVIKRNTYPVDYDNEEGFETGIDMGMDSSLVNMLLFFHAFGQGGSAGSFGGSRHWKCRLFRSESWWLGLRE
ncbi:putative zinc finger, RING/FYVE/PHD-type containing protein [Tanacetum coccineum]|uniref:Zinc finger, RING/FYVE/PHD-type containing protein n=1 Tax=Tanacetum coccineum TaxID=301880 RepID=A0ABQ4XQU2_9ASTR